LTTFNNYIDPLFLEKITYIDINKKRRVKNPYRNRRSYQILVPVLNGAGNFVWEASEDIVGKSVFVTFPAQVIYSFTVSAATKEVTIIGIPLFTLIEINVVNPKPLPPSDTDLLWDDLGYDSQKSIVAAWGDIDLICNVLYPASAESELGFDDQNTIKYGLVGWKNNCGNGKSRQWGRVEAPNNGIYNPPQPIPTPEPPPPTDVGHDYDFKFVLRWEDNSTADLDFFGYIDHNSKKGVSYSNKEYTVGEDKMWLDFDYTSHGSDGYASSPEIITLLGFKLSVISIQINNYSGKPVTQNVIVEVVNASQEVLKTITIPSYQLSGNHNTVWACDFTPSTGDVTEKIKVVPLGTFN
jgi:hypothetical protein